MAESDEKPNTRDDEIAQVADAYYQARKNGAATSVEAILGKHPHLGSELRESLEAIELLLPAPRESMPEVLGEFQIQKEIGRGGMGIVYLATQASLQRKVALKVLRLSRNDTQAEERFEREAQTVAALSHEQIVPIYAFGKVDGIEQGEAVAFP